MDIDTTEHDLVYVEADTTCRTVEQYICRYGYRGAQGKQASTLHRQTLIQCDISLASARLQSTVGNNE